VLADELHALELSLESGRLPSLRVPYALLQSVTAISLDYALSHHSLRADACRTKLADSRARLIALANKIPAVLHPAVLHSQGASFVGFVAALKCAVADLDYHALDRCIGAIDGFNSDRREQPELFAAFFSTAQQPLSLASSPAADEEKAVLRAEANDLELQLIAAKQEFERQKDALAISMRELRELEYVAPMAPLDDH
jgi:hypothetical protein